MHLVTDKEIPGSDRPLAVVATDVGGTNIRVGAIGCDGKVVERSSTKTRHSLGPSEFVRSICEMAEELINSRLKGFEVVGFAAAFPAVLDIGSGVVTESPNLPFLNDYPLKARFAHCFNVPVVVENDATASALGEYRFGAARNAAIALCLTLGTGVGGGVIIDGKPLRGIDGTAGELGHVCVEPDGPECGCGSKGCLEQYASATGLSKLFTALEHDFPDSKLYGRANITPLDLYEYAVQRDRLALAVFDRMGEALGVAIAGFINIFNPEIIVIGGGLSGAWDMFSGSMRETIKARAFRRPAERAKLVRAELGDDAGMIGAASLVFDMRKSG